MSGLIIKNPNFIQVSYKNSAFQFSKDNGDPITVIDRLLDKRIDQNIPIIESNLNGLKGKICESDVKLRYVISESGTHIDESNSDRIMERVNCKPINLSSCGLQTPDIEYPTELDVLGSRILETCISTCVGECSGESKANKLVKLASHICESFVLKSKLYEMFPEVTMVNFNHELFESSCDKSIDPVAFNSVLSVIANISRENSRCIAPRVLSKLNDFLAEEELSDRVEQQYRGDYSNMNAIANIQNLFLNSGTYTPDNSGYEPVAVYISEMNPFNAEDVKNIRALKEQYGYRVVLTCVHVDRTSDNSYSRFRVSEDLVKSQMSCLKVSDLSDVIVDYLIVYAWDLKEIVKLLRPKYSPMLVATDTGLSTDLLMQYYTNEVLLGKRLNLPDDFNIIEYENNIGAMVLRYISLDDSMGYMENTHSSLNGLWSIIQSEYKYYNNERFTKIKEIKNGSIYQTTD